MGRSRLESCHSFLETFEGFYENKEPPKKVGFPHTSNKDPRRSETPHSLEGLPGLGCRAGGRLVLLDPGTPSKAAHQNIKAPKPKTQNPIRTLGAQSTTLYITLNQP